MIKVYPTNVAVNAIITNPSVDSKILIIQMINSVEAKC